MKLSHQIEVNLLWWIKSNPLYLSFKVQPRQAEARRGKLLLDRWYWEKIIEVNSLILTVLGDVDPAISLSSISVGLWQVHTSNTICRGLGYDPTAQTNFGALTVQLTIDSLLSRLLCGSKKTSILWKLWAARFNVEKSLIKDATNAIHITILEIGVYIYLVLFDDQQSMVSSFFMAVN